jgi:hypothetical protein
MLSIHQDSNITTNEVIDKLENKRRKLEFII